MIQLIAEVLAALVAVVLLFLYVIMPGINRILWKPAYVLLINPYEDAVTMNFMGQDYPVQAGASLTIPDIFGRLPRTELLTLVPKAGGAATIKVKVGLRAGQTVLVNPAGIMTFGVMKRNADGHGVTAAQKQDILNELQKNIAPVAALKAADGCRKDGAEALLAYTDKTLVYSDDPVVNEGLDFAQLGLKPSDRQLEKRGSETNPRPDVVTRNLLRGVSLKDVKVYYRHGDREVAECEFPVSFGNTGTFVPLRQIGKNVPSELRDCEALSGDGVCRVRYDETQTVVHICPNRSDFRVRRNQRDLAGAWEYTATLQKNGQWTWKWHFSGQDAIKVATLSINVAMDGQVSIKYRENRKGK